MHSQQIDRVQSGRQQWRTRAWIVLMAVIITALVLTLIPVMHRIATARQATHKHTFMEYVTTHHLGTLTVIDSGTGLDPVSYMLTVPRPISASERQAFITRLMQKYYLYDKGELLSIVYRSKNGDTHPLASAHYDDTTDTLQLTINLPSGNTQVVRQHVRW
ncbi:MAG: hypothetical protein K6T63_09165 [Alicyclobacillus herbarius]|uniref:hypothetical protein n=1 Tax=Alicyclobacillus herbarius TaxID=122960 RepID=UPI0004125C0D|nr:hypothetical protein [Alicyclobacillus herbarius]MCL6632790.1 hypothetical protein [Alicyclobacillus herbarius]